MGVSPFNADGIPYVNGLESSRAWYGMSFTCCCFPITGGWFNSNSNLIQSNSNEKCGRKSARTYLRFGRRIGSGGWRLDLPLDRVTLEDVAVVVVVVVAAVVVERVLERVLARRRHRKRFAGRRRRCRWRWRTYRQPGQIKIHLRQKPKNFKN